MSLGVFGVAEDGSGAVNQEHADVPIPTLADRTEPANLPAGRLSWSQAEVAGEAARRREPVDVSNDRDESGGGEEADAGDGTELGNHGSFPSQSCELIFDGCDAGFELTDFLAHFSERGSYGIRKAGFRVFERGEDGGNDPKGTKGNHETKLPEDPPCRVDPGSTTGQPARAQAMEGREGLLGDGLDGNGMNVSVAEGLEDTLRVGLVRLVADDVGPDGVRGKSTTRCP